MAYEDYVNAQKQGMRAYRNCVARGEYPYLPVLEEILSHTGIEHEVHLGVEEIPLSEVVGTCTAGRTRAFASNFMPLLDQKSEFAGKWIRLFDAQLSEGIRDAVNVYEYMNKYYVTEGNKRVSVLKFLDCPSILADVTRKVPRRSEEPANQIYYEYMDFYALTKINYLRFSKPGRYARLLATMGKGEKETWSREEQLDFFSFYMDFSTAFEEKNGRRISNVTVGDALLFYLTLYSYQEVRHMPRAQISVNLEKLWPEIVLLGQEDSIELSMDPAAQRNTMSFVLNKIRPVRKRCVAFVYDKNPEASDWIYGHELGRLYLKEVFGGAVETKVYLADPEESVSEEVLERICLEGCDIIFAVTPRLIRACLKAAAAHPEVIVLNCALNSPHNVVRTYYTRRYEAKFLTGMVAGVMCRNDRVGYIEDYPLYGAAADINAFAMGAKMVNPRVRVHLGWSTQKEFDADSYFREQGITCICGQDMITPQEDMRNFGLYEESGSGKINLAVSICNWGVFYEKIIWSILHGLWKAEETPANKAINYWWGMSAGVIDVICSNRLPAGTIHLVELMKKNISSDIFHPLTGPLVQQGGRVHYRESEVMRPEDITRMDWLVENVVGHIPAIDELKEEAQAVVKLRGLYAVVGQKGGDSLP